MEENGKTDVAVLGGFGSRWLMGQTFVSPVKVLDPHKASLRKPQLEKQHHLDFKGVLHDKKNKIKINPQTNN